MMQKRNLRGAKQMTHEPIHTVHLTPHITWQGTQAELEAMQKEGWPLGGADLDRIAELERNILAAERRLKILAAERRLKILAAERRLKRLARWLDLSDEELNNLPIGSIVDDHRKMQADVNAVLAALKGETDD
jgi:hypothetical protein